MSVEVLQPEAGDDRNKDVEIAKLEEMYDAAPAFERQDIIIGPGDILPHQVSKFGHLALTRAHIMIGRGN